MTYCANHIVILETQIDDILRDIANSVNQMPAVASKIKSIYLGGGYGRGEGGALLLDNGEIRLYNDLDLFVFTKKRYYKKSRDFLIAFFKSLEDRLTKEFNVHVEFGPLTVAKKMEKESMTLMYQELLRGNVLVWGESTWLDKVPQIPWDKIGQNEFLRLLLNRGTGLYLASEKLNNVTLTVEDCDFILRNIYKSILAIGDTYLFMNKCYTFKSSERLKAINSLSLPLSLKQFYAEALAFKIAPKIGTNLDLRALLNDAKTFFKEISDTFLKLYTHQANNKERLKNILRNLKVYKTFHFCHLTGHPRDTLFVILYILLYGHCPITHFKCNTRLFLNMPKNILSSLYLFLWSQHS